jgi:circadian clock protein KaiC
VKKGLLHVAASRPTLYGLEGHLVQAHRLIQQHRPSAVVVDPISNLVVTGTIFETRSMLTRLVDFVKTQGITGFFTTLTPGGEPRDRTEEEISSLIDTWVQLRDLPAPSRRRRTIAVVKSRGMPHSTASHELVLSGAGLHVGPAPEAAEPAGGALAGGMGPRPAVRRTRRRAGHALREASP